MMHEKNNGPMLRDDIATGMHYALVERPEIPLKTVAAFTFLGGIATAALEGDLATGGGAVLGGAMLYKAARPIQNFMHKYMV